MNTIYINGVECFQIKVKEHYEYHYELQDKAYFINLERLGNINLFYATTIDNRRWRIQAQDVRKWDWNERRRFKYYSDKWSRIKIQVRDVVSFIFRR